MYKYIASAERFSETFITVSRFKVISRKDKQTDLLGDEVVSLQIFTRARRSQHEGEDEVQKSTATAKHMLFYIYSF